jgi:hypothetical protein
MKTNPGGQLAPDQIVGRDQLITGLWQILEGRSIYMNDLRRIGKTQIMVKMHAQGAPNWATVKCDLGGFHTAAEFATQVYRMSDEVIGLQKKAFRRMGDLIDKLKGSEIGGIIKLPDGAVAPWKEVLRRTFADVNDAMEALGQENRIVYLWDEVPFLLDNIAKREGASVAMEVLDVLRALGQDHDRIRLLLTGSIGLHHILNTLKAEGYSNSPLNRMELVQPGPLDRDDAVSLATALLQGDGVDCADIAECAATVSDAVGGVSFYIHKLISRLPRGQTATAQSIEAILKQEITSDNNDWDLEHYRQRLKTYYGIEEPLALKVLDCLACNESLTFQAIRKELSANKKVDDERLRNLLGLLCRDHYLIRTIDNQYRFYLTLIRTWWKVSRNL